MLYIYTILKIRKKLKEKKHNKCYINDTIKEKLNWKTNNIYKLKKNNKILESIKSIKKSREFYYNSNIFHNKKSLILDISDLDCSLTNIASYSIKNKYNKKNVNSIDLFNNNNKILDTIEYNCEIKNNKRCFSNSIKRSNILERNNIHKGYSIFDNIMDKNAIFKHNKINYNNNSKINYKLDFSL